MTDYGFFFDATRCTGCKTCEAACRDYNNLEIENTFRRVYEVEGGGWHQDESGAWVTDSFTYFTTTSCQHCGQPACTKVCPTGAMHKDKETGIVSVDAGKCIGCGYCHMACPYNAPKVDRTLGHSIKCDGCASRIAAGKKPICVEACSMRAIKFEPIDTIPDGYVMADIAPLPPKSYTTPHYYIKQSYNARPSDDMDVMIANPLEVR